MATRRKQRRNKANMSDETKAETSQVREGQRIAKVMARAGICSRRDAEAWIAEGRVSVNGEVLSSPAFNVNDADDVRVDGERLGAAERTRLFLFHKPRGFVTTARDPEGRPTVFAALPPGLPRVVAVGRLDINTEGLLLLTNDGGLARVLELPSTGWLRRYRVRAHGNIDQAALDRLSGGIAIDGVDYLGIEAKLDREQGSNVWITLGLREGKNREIKKVLEHLGLAVNRLIRVSFGPFELGDLGEGEAAEVRTRVLRDQLGVKLAKEAQADFDAPLIAREAPTPTEPSADERSARRASAAPGRAADHKPKRDRERERGGERERRFDPDAAARRAPPAPSTVERRRKHVSRLRAEIAADAAATRKRIERSATHDRKGRTIAVERISPTGEEARRRAAAETQKPRAARHNAGKRGPEGRERPPRPDNREGGRRAEFERPQRAERREGGPRERSFDRPQGRKHDRAGESRPPRADAKDRGPRSEFKPRGARAEGRDGAPRARRFDRSADQRKGERESDRPRERAFDRPQGQKHDRGGESRPPRADARDRGARSEFKPREPRAKAGDGAPPARRFDRPPDRREGARETDRPRGHRREKGGGNGAPRAGASPGRSPRAPGKGPPKGRGGPRRPPRKP
jgi:23S rRNA pseudouridine2605 synthase